MSLKQLGSFLFGPSPPPEFEEIQDLELLADCSEGVAGRCGTADDQDMVYAEAIPDVLLDPVD